MQANHVHVSLRGGAGLRVLSPEREVSCSPEQLHGRGATGAGRQWGGGEGGGHSREVTAVSKGTRQKMTQRVGER